MDLGTSICFLLLALYSLWISGYSRNLEDRVEDLEEELTDIELERTYYRDRYNWSAKQAKQVRREQNRKQEAVNRFNETF